MGIFIQIVLRPDAISPEQAKLLVRLCPVDIFALAEGSDQLTVRTDQEDECTLCALCLQKAPAGAVSIFKTYTGETLRSTGETD